MKILHIIDSLGLGGAQTVIKGIFESQKSNQDIFLYALRKRETNIKVSHQNVIIYDSQKKYSLKPIKELKSLIEKEKISILHCHLFRSQVFGYILKKRYFPKIKLIFHEHGEIFQNHFIYDMFMKKAKGVVDLFIAVSKSTKEELVKKAHIKPDKIKVLYNFVDLKRFNPKKIKLNVKREKEVLGIIKKDFVIGFVGRLNKVKGCEYLIKALPSLDFSYKVLIVGDGPERKRLGKLVNNLKLSKRVLFLGFVHQPEKIYKIMDLLIIPSLSEASPMSLLEARALKIPVIASNIKQIKEILPNNLLFDKGDFLEIAEKIKIFKKHLKSLRKKFEQSIKINDYSLKKYVGSLKIIYKSL